MSGLIDIPRGKKRKQMHFLVISKRLRKFKVELKNPARNPEIKILNPENKPGKNSARYRSLVFTFKLYSRAGHLTHMLSMFEFSSTYATDRLPRLEELNLIFNLSARRD